ncbi:tetratricopeptide repeat protein [Bradymonadales bacterium TMQ1]|uniref:Tetratricopeptide repeat protein n=1 Tax=Lujinxingia sediminis TaxID=2480984 RepID=A0ABY0CYZ3_9DELT|nr:transglycosylase SLT domain-containing protein [Lujinxingia sediminis]RVU48660.1 tetratricopeptide repeat protein [Lujinxingia sediminis]TXC77953.1 tetratricopeptide repeat protein [Bradymonadales bacterium TMQ1]
MTFARLSSLCLTLGTSLWASAAWGEPALSGDELIDQNIPPVECATETCQAGLNAQDESRYLDAATHFTAHAASLAQPAKRQPWLVKAAYAFERTEDWHQAAQHYAQAARIGGELQNFLWTQAARAQLNLGVDSPLIDEVLATRALEEGFSGGAFSLVRIQTERHGLPSAESTAAMLRHDDSDEVCPWLVTTLVDAAPSEARNALADQAFAHCIDPGHDNAFDELAFNPSSDSRRERADRLFSAVRFEDARVQLDAIDMSTLNTMDRCRADFRLARTLFRLRQPERAEALYRDVVKTCTDDANEDERVRSLYAVGNRNYHRGRLDDAETFFKQLLEDYPERSHADDALFYLARVTRQRGDHQQELQLLSRALQDYPEGDMVHELVWESHENLYRTGDFEAFTSAVTALDLPERDAQYFSQGRLEYFVGQAYRQLSRPALAERYLQRAWVKYPFSFYGYLAHLRLLEMNLTPEPLSPDSEDTRVTWFEGDFAGSGAATLAAAHHFEGACEYERARQQQSAPSESERWRLAGLCHKAKRFPLSHNIARRSIPGRPWALPRKGRVTRWHVAWPNPYQTIIADAVEAERAQAPDIDLHPGFPASIMREESSFIEDVVSWAGAHGLMQLMPATALDHDRDIEGRATPEKLKTAEVNIRVGVDHLFTLANRLDGHPVLMAAAYNAGAGRIGGWLRRQPNDEIALWVEDIPFLETRDYSKRVIGTYAAYQWLQGTTQLDARIANPAR